MKTQLTIEDLKVGTELEFKSFKNGELTYSTKWTISNITSKNIMYRDGESHVFQYNKIEIKRYTIKKFLDLLNNGSKNKEREYTLKIAK